MHAILRNHSGAHLSLHNTTFPVGHSCSLMFDEWTLLINQLDDDLAASSELCTLTRNYGLRVIKSFWTETNPTFQEFDEGFCCVNTNIKLYSFLLCWTILGPLHRDTSLNILSPSFDNMAASCKKRLQRASQCTPVFEHNWTYQNGFVS